MFDLSEKPEPLESTQPAGNFLVPADMAFENPPSASAAAAPPKAAKKPRHFPHASPSAEMDDYFKEGEEKSQKEDHAPTHKTSGLPPPPKAGPGKSPSPALES
jgi:hypothetical protein